MQCSQSKGEPKKLNLKRKKGGDIAALNAFLTLGWAAKPMGFITINLANHYCLEPSEKVNLNIQLNQRFYMTAVNSSGFLSRHQSSFQI